MIISFIKYLMVLTLGLVFGYLIFTEQVVQPPIEVGLNDETTEKVTEFTNPMTQVTPLEITEVSTNPQKDLLDADLINKLNQQIEFQQKKISELENLLSQKNSANQTSLKNLAQDEQLTPQAIETLSMQDFESKMKDQFLDRFKGYAIELDGERLDSIKKEFNKDSTKADWNVDYENNINAFLQDNDPNRLHYVDELICNSNMCRLKVNTNQPNNWQQLFLRMTQQAWYNSITLSESSGDPSIFIYFMTKPQNHI